MCEGVYLYRLLPEGAVGEARQGGCTMRGLGRVFLRGGGLE